MKTIILIISTSVLLISQDVTVWVSNADTSSIEVSMINSAEVAGFQFIIQADTALNAQLVLSDTTVEGIVLLEVVGIEGSAVEAGFDMFGNTANKVLGVSFSGATIPASDESVLLVLEWETSFLSEWTVTLVEPKFIGVGDTGSPPIFLDVQVLEPFLGITDNYLNGFSLNNNYPNPFNPSTTIEYTVLYPREVNITIYDILGKKVRTLVSDYHTPAQYRIIWNGVTDEGYSVPSGTYIYTLRSGEFTKSKKLLFMK